MKTFACMFALMYCLAPGAARAQEAGIESISGKTVLVFSPHPDDELWGAGGTIALLNQRHNRVLVVLYTNDDKGSYDPEMSSQRLARIRKAEEEAAEAVLAQRRRGSHSLSRPKEHWRV